MAPILSQLLIDRMLFVCFLNFYNKYPRNLYLRNEKCWFFMLHSKMLYFLRCNATHIFLPQLQNSKFLGYLLYEFKQKASYQSAAG